MKRTGRDHDGRVTILPPMTAEEHIVVQRESKARTTLLQSVHDDHVADFHYLDDARDIWNAVKARMQKILSQLNQLKAKLDAEDINLKFLRALPSSWSQVALTLKTKGSLEFLSFDDLYYKLKTLEVDIKGYSTFPSSQSAGPSHSAFVSATSTSKKMSYGDSPNYSLTTTYYVPSNSMTGSHRSGNVIEDVLQSFVADTEPEQQLAYEDLKQIEKLDLEEMDLKWKMAMLSGKGRNDKQRYSSFKIKEIGKKEDDSKSLITVDTLVDWTNHDSESDGVIAAKEFVQAYKNSLKTLEKQKRVLQRNQLTLEDKIRVLSIELENTSNLLKHSERINADFKTAKKDLNIKLDNHLAQTKNKNELGWDDSAFSVFTTNYEDVEGRPIFHRFAKTNSLKVVPLPLIGDYTSLSDHTDLDESQMSYGTMSSTSCDPKYFPNDFVSYDDSDKCLKVNTNDFASSDSSVKSLEHKPTDSTSRASTSSVSTSVNEAEIESNVGTPIKKHISVMDLPSFPCNSPDKNKHTSRTSCNKNGSLIKRHVILGNMLHLFLSPVVRPQSVPNGKPKVKPVPTGKPKVTPVPTGKPKVTPVPTGKPKVTPVPTGKPTVTPISTGKPKVTPVPTGKLHVSTPVPTGRPNRPFPVPTDRGYSPLVIYGWWSPTEDEGIFDSGCSRSMTGNKERLDDFHAFHGRKVTFGGGKQHKASYKAINAVSFIPEPLHLLYMDLFGPTSTRSIDHKYYCLVITDDYSSFYWVLFLEHKDETYLILKNFINLVENQLNKKVKAIRCDNGTEFKNSHMIELCGSKGIKKEYSNPRTPQQNRVAER
nr:putative ribonuclease H-like domain-containing protein [Tanacetum cinerariifolium]